MERMNDPEARQRQVEEIRAQAAAQAPSASSIQQMVGEAASRAQQAAPKADTADQLTKLEDLRDRGVLSDAEFEAQKAKLLADN